ncbi:hypothetical protein GQ464_013320 [Rhodocaloribacter litoris]|uniref:hypothetical protein n=1 Tax=Rhodocaloribacter litoris TaxID=2558931 RepID=UPI001421465B|nr:hypothetical protein [Rhodocaloribacter litoris]QXD14412.1 hypothetical protein GQ464_013320 [Rhodocaloribacter litoris]
MLHFKNGLFLTHYPTPTDRVTYTTLKQRFPASLRGVFLLMLIGIAFPLSVLGQETSCAHGNIQWTQSQMQAMLSSQAEVPTSGQFRALIVFVRFKDDTFNDTCNDKWLAWHTSDMLPDMAHDFLAPGGAGGQARVTFGSCVRASMKKAAYPDDCPDHHPQRKEGYATHET